MSLFSYLYSFFFFTNEISMYISKGTHRNNDSPPMYSHMVNTEIFEPSNKSSVNQVLHNGANIVEPKAF